VGYKINKLLALTAWGAYRADCERIFRFPLSAHVSSHRPVPDTSAAKVVLAACTQNREAINHATESMLDDQDFMVRFLCSYEACSSVLCRGAP